MRFEDKVIPVGKEIYKSNSVSVFVNENNQLLIYKKGTLLRTVIDLNSMEQVIARDEICVSRLIDSNVDSYEDGNVRLYKDDKIEVQLGIAIEPLHYTIDILVPRGIAKLDIVEPRYLIINDVYDKQVTLSRDELEYSIPIIESVWSKMISEINTGGWYDSVPEDLPIPDYMKLERA